MPQIEIKLYAMLRDRLPPGSRGVTGHLPIESGATIAGILDRLGVPTDWRQLVVLNDSEIPADRWAETAVRDGDRLAVFPPIAGG